MIKGLYSTHPRQLGRYRKIKVTMARQIMGLCNEDATVVDHINHNGLDNRKSNLRVCTVQQNTQNKNKDRGCTSSYKGVSKRSRGSRWVVMVRNKHVGYFDTELLAAKAYDEEAKKQYGEYACLNFPNEIAV